MSKIKETEEFSLLEKSTRDLLRSIYENDSPKNVFMEEIDEIAKLLVRMLEKEFPGEEFVISRTLKTNETLTAITRKNGDVCPRQSVEDFLGWICYKGLSVKEAFIHMVENYKKSVPISYKETIANWRSTASAQIINAEKNAELLETVPHKKFLDLAIIVKLTENMGTESYSILVQNNVLPMLGEWEEVLSVALENSFIHKDVISMENILKELFGEDFEEEIPEYDIAMMVLSNDSRSNGAISAFDTRILADLSKEHNGSDLVILPSSIHECICMEKPDDSELDTLKSMVADINNTQVCANERLSYNIYIYNSEKNEISMY